MSRPDEQLRHSLRSYAAHLANTYNAPPASLIWLRAERRRRRVAIERAERPLRIMQIVGMICAASAAGWMLHRSGPVQFSTSSLTLALGCAALIVAGCWTMLLASRRPSSS